MSTGIAPAPDPRIALGERSLELLLKAFYATGRLQLYLLMRAQALLATLHSLQVKMPPAERAARAHLVIAGKLCDVAGEYVFRAAAARSRGEEARACLYQVDAWRRFREALRLLL